MHVSVSFLASFSTFLLLLVHPCAWTLSLGVTAVVQAVVTKIAKRLLAQKRPDGAPFADPGMPSSHASMLFFLAAFVSAHQDSLLLSLSLLATAAVLSVLRVRAGYHTYAQIAAGAALGLAGAAVASSVTDAYVQLDDVIAANETAYRVVATAVTAVAYTQKAILKRIAGTVAGKPRTA